MIINVEPNNFGGPLRAGDIIAVLNYAAYLRKKPEYSDIQFHFPDHSVNPAAHCILFRDWLEKNTNYLSVKPGTNSLNMNNVNLWDLRSVTGDVLKLYFHKKQKKKICVFPLLDAPYNHYRNWSHEMMHGILDHYSQEQYNDYEKIICSHMKIEKNGWKHSSDYISNIEHIIDCSHFVGGDTGTSHFASVIDGDEKKINYYYGSIGLLHTTPFYALQGQGNINMFWNNNWRTDLL